MFTEAVGENEKKEQVETLLVREEQECSDENVLKLIREKPLSSIVRLLLPSV